MTTNTKFSSSQKSHFSKGFNPCFQSKNAIFFLDLFSVKKGLELRFNDVLNSPKNRTFPKGLTHAFGQKMQFFLYLFSVKKELEIRYMMF